ncbi:MAG TPA: helix-turn-helix domain-containing protein [Vicinamibacteria bacterium]
MSPVLQEVPACARDVDRLIYRSNLVAIGAWRCPTRHPLFRDSGPIRDHCLSFPRTAAVIEPDNAEPFVADPTVVELYNAGQEYRRRPVSPQGAESDYFAFSPAVLDGALPFGASHLCAGAPLYLRQRRLVNAVRSGELDDPLEIEESVLGVLGQVLRLARAEPRCATTRESGRRRAALADAAARELAADLALPLPLGLLARRLRASPFHLCRVFRERTGRSLHRHRTELRLRGALERIEQGADLTSVALDFGFSSHSHFTASFRTSFGIPPSRLRRFRSRTR